MNWMRRAALAAALLGLTVCFAQPGAAQQEKKQPGKGGKAKSWDDVADAALKYLKGTQADDGSWSKAAHPGITAVVLNGLLRTGKVSPGDPTVDKALAFIEAMADPAEGHLAKGNKAMHKNYQTSVNVAALKASGVKKYDPLIASGVAYLKKAQIGAGDEKPTDNPGYGGFGYGPDTRADLSNTHMALDTLTLVGTPKDDPVFKKAVVFVSNTQNLKSEHNTQPWAGKINDGSFIYVLGGGGPATTPADTPRPGYGSMTFAGIKALTQCGIGQSDPRMKKAMEWVAKNYSVDINPGRQEGAGGQGYYYYLVTMAKALSALGIDEVTDANGKAHDWRADITRALANRQRPDGSWNNDFTTWLEGTPDLDAGFALTALSYAKPKAK